MNHRTNDFMEITVHVPQGLVIDAQAGKIVAESEDGHFCLLPAHVDMLANLVAGILVYEDLDGREHLVAVDRGTLIKSGREVRVAVRSAVEGRELSKLTAMVRKNFVRLSDREITARSSAAKLEAGFVRAFLNFETHNL